MTTQEIYAALAEAVKEMERAIEESNAIPPLLSGRIGRLLEEVDSEQAEVFRRLVDLYDIGNESPFNIHSFAQKKLGALSAEVDLQRSRNPASPLPTVSVRPTERSVALRQRELNLLRKLVDVSSSLADDQSIEFIVNTPLGGSSSVMFLMARGPLPKIDGFGMSDIHSLERQGYVMSTGKMQGFGAPERYRVTHEAFELFRQNDIAEFAKGITFETGDRELDDLLDAAITKYELADPKAHQDALEKLWDAWERLKSLTASNQQQKKASADGLLDQAATERTFRERLGVEADQLNRFGNDFRIRHSETFKIPLSDDYQRNYLFERMLSMIRFLLRKSGRM